MKTKNPFLNAFFALLYIVIVVLVMFYGTKHLSERESIIAPIAVISLFTLSAAVMGYLFCYEPIRLYLDGKRKQAVDFFLKTIAVFAGITVFILMLLFSGIFS